MTEYAVTLSVTAAAFTAIGIGVNRSLQARVKAGADSYTKIQRNIGIPSVAGAPELVVNFGAGNQYENYATQQEYATYTERVNQTHMPGNGSILQEKVSDVTARAAGGFTRQHGAAHTHVLSQTLRQGGLDLFVIIQPATSELLRQRSPQSIRAGWAQSLRDEIAA